MKEGAENRLDIVNKIIEKISENGRKFFRYNDFVAVMFIDNGKLYMRSEWHGEKMRFFPNCDKPKKWHHGGTLLGLVRDFTDFIYTGEYSNHNNGYGGLYCVHWGYPDGEMKEIQDYARELGYLNDARP